MNDDCWQCVFDFLPTLDRIRCERVSKRWNRLLRNSWKRLHSVDSNELCIGTPPCQWSDCVRAILARCSAHITSFKFGRNRVEIVQKDKDELWLAQLLSKMFHPKERFRLGEESLHPDVLVKLIEKAPALRSFRIQNCFIWSDAVRLLPKLPSTLKVFCMEKCAADFFDEGTVNECFFSMLKNCSTLEEFTVTGDGLCYSNFQIDDAFMQHIPPTVSVLCVSAGNLLGIRDVTFTRRLQNLRLFDARNSYLRRDALKELVLNAPNLLYLDLSNCRSRLRDFSPIRKLTQLRCLLLNGTRGRGVLKDNHLNAIIDGCKSLEVLSLKGCTWITPDGWKAIKKCTALKELYICYVRSMTDEVLSTIICGTTQLRVLDVSFCKNLTTKSLKGLTALQNLTRLFVSGIHCVNKAFVNMMHKYRPNCVIEAVFCKYSLRRDAPTDDLTLRELSDELEELMRIMSSNRLCRYQYL